MKATFLAILIVLAGGGIAGADGGFQALSLVNTTIPDGDLNGVQFSQTVTGLSGPIGKITVEFNLSGGFNGDYYASLWHNNTLAVLLNRPGRSASSASGYFNSGFGPDAAAHPFTFDDNAAADVHFYQGVGYTLNNGQLTGSWQPDGRLIDPLSPGANFTTAARSSKLGVFNNLDPNGDWVLYIADVAAGSEGSLVSWNLNIIPVPEPSSVALAWLGAFALLVRRFSRRRVHTG